MKLSALVPGFLRRTDPSLSQPILADFNLKRAPLTPFEAMEEHLSELIARETEARAAHEAAVRALNEYSEKLKLTVETHLSSINALYTRVPPVNT